MRVKHAVVVATVAALVGTGAVAAARTVPSAGSAAVTVSPGANLFLGLSVTGDGTIYASGGNADRVFRYHLTGPAAVPEDATEAAFLPTHNATNGLQARLNGGQAQAAPASDGVLVGGYPGESIAYDAHPLLLVGRTLSEPSAPGNQMGRRT